MWYLLAAAFDNTASVRCEVTGVEGDDDDEGENTKRVSCHSQAYASQLPIDGAYAIRFRSDGTCVGPDVSSVTLTDDGRYKVTQAKDPSLLVVHEMTREGFVLYQDDDHLLLYGCGKTNEDGSCVSDEERVSLFSRHRSIGNVISPPLWGVMSADRFPLSFQIATPFPRACSARWTVSACCRPRCATKKKRRAARNRRWLLATRKAVVASENETRPMPARCDISAPPPRYTNT